MTSGLSVGLAIYNLLNGAIAGVRKVFPVVADEAVMPYIVYRRASMDPRLPKDGYGADTVMVELQVVTDTYSRGVTIAERVRELLDGVQLYDEATGLKVRRMQLSTSEEGWEANAFVQQLTFKVMM